MSLKTSGTALPKLERAKSVVNVDVSEKLMNSSFEVLFREVDRYVKMLRMHKGIDWSTYVQQRNLAKKDNRDME